MNIAHLLLGAAQEFRDITALARGDAVHLGYRDLWRKVSVMSTHLAARFGLSRGDRVAFAMTNCVESIEVMYAIWHAGLCAVPMNAKLHAKEFAFILENSGARLCFVTPDLAATIAEAAKEAPALKEIVDVTTRAYALHGGGRSQPDRRLRADRHGVAVLHLGHDRPAQGRDAQPSQPAGHDAELLCRRRPSAGRQLDGPCRPDQPRLGPVELPDGGARRHAGLPRERPLRRAGDGRADEPLARLQHLPRADHGEAPDRAWQRERR